MQKSRTKIVSFILTLCLIVSLFAGLSFSASAGSSKNTGDRHTLCTALSASAEAYYSGEYAWDSMSELQGVDTDSSLAAMKGELYGELQELMDDTMTDSVTYKSLTDYWKTTDCEDGSGNPVLFYSDVKGSDYNREHVWPKSRGSFYQKNAGSDLHHLRPTDSTINSTRGNHTMGDVVGVLQSYSTASYGGKTVLYYNAGCDLVEVNDDIKGDVARILLYVYVRWGQPNLCEDVSSSNLPAYDSDDSDNNGQAVIEDLDTLLQWCEEDPVDTWEMSRNDCVQYIQGNRNVFIDYPEYAWLLFDREVPEDMPTPSHEAENSEQYTITAVSSDTECGTVSVSGHTVTAYPADGYYIGNATVSPAGSADITRSGSKFILTNIKSDCTVTVSFIKDSASVPVTLSFSAPCEISPIRTMYGKSVTLPSCNAAVEGYTFAGWVESSLSETTQKPVYYAAGSSYTVNAATTLYALYSRTELGTGTGGNAELVSVAPADWSGSYVIAASSKKVMMTSASPSGTYLNGDNATVSGSSITNAAASNTFTLSKVGSYYTIQDSSGAYLKCSGAKSISLDSSKSSVTASDTAYLWSIGTSGISAATASYGKLQYNASAPRFTTYTSSQTAISLYRIGAGSTVYYKTVAEAVPHQHSYTAVITQPTCTEKGYTTHTCTCGDSYVDSYTDALGHDFGAWQTVTPASCTEGGQEKRCCSRCTEVEYKPLLMKGHDYHNGICTRCGDADNPFTDVKEGTPYFEAILWAYYHEPKQITAGFTDTEFCPNAVCTRGQVVTFLWRAAGEPQPESSVCPFVDVSESSPYRAAIIWALEKGITYGMDSTHFAPSRSVTRAQFVTFLWRYVGSPSTENAVNPFTDVSGSSVYLPAILWAVENSITQGYGNKDFRPDTVCTRWHVVVFMQRALDKEE